MKLRECNLGDLMYVCCQIRQDEWLQIEKFTGSRDLDALVNRCYAVPGEKWTFVDEAVSADSALVVCGFAPIRHGVYASWFLASGFAWDHYGKQVTDMAAERLQYKLKSGAHRIETLCLASRTLAHVWYRRIGLQLESTLKAYCVDGSDAVMYVALKGEA